MLPGLLGAVAQAARLQPEQPRGAVAARGDAGLAAPLPEGLIQEVDGGLRAVRGGELRRLPGLLGAVAQAAWLQVDQPRGAVVAQRRGGLAAPLPQRLVQERDAVSLPVGGGELRGLPGLLRAVAQAARLQPEQGGGAVIAEGRAGLTAPLPQRLVQEDDGGLLPVRSRERPELPHLIRHFCTPPWFSRAHAARRLQRDDPMRRSPPQRSATARRYRSSRKPAQPVTSRPGPGISPLSGLRPPLMPVRPPDARSSPDVRSS